MKKNMTRHVASLVTCLLSILTTGLAWSAPTVDLLILNTPNENNQFIVETGSEIEVSFTVNDPDNELKKKDRIELFNLSTQEAVRAKKRGQNLTGSVSLKVRRRDLTGDYVVRYVNDSLDPINETPAVPVELPILVFENLEVFNLENRVATNETAIGDLDSRTSVIEDLITNEELVGPQGPQGPAGEAGPAGPQGPAGIASNVFAGSIDLMDPAASALPSGWSVTEDALGGVFTLTHNLNTTAVSLTSSMLASSFNTDHITLNTLDLNSITFTHFDNTGVVLVDPFDTLLMQFIVVAGGFSGNVTDPSNAAWSFEYNGNTAQTFVVPDGVTSITAKLWGAGGGEQTCSNREAVGGAGGFSQGDILVTPGEVLTIYVAEGGGSTSGYRHAAGGGGGSSVRRGEERLIVAGGGGGAALDNGDGGDGGGLEGTTV